MSRRIRALAIALIVLALPSIAFAANPTDSQVLDRWELELGSFFSSTKTEIRIDPLGTGEGTTINLEDDLDFESSKAAPRITGSYLLGRHHQFSIGYFKSDRDSTETITREIIWGDETFPVSVTVGALFDSTFLTFEYTYWIWNKQRWAAGASFALVNFDLAMGIGASIDGTEAGIRITEKVETTVPVPQIGFSYRFAMTPKFIFNTEATILKFAEVSGYDGEALGGFLGVEHRTWKNFGFGLKYNWNDYKLEESEENSGKKLGKFEYNINGFQLYLRAAF